MTPDTGGIWPHGGAGNALGPLRLGLPEQRAAGVMGGLALPPNGARPG